MSESRSEELLKSFNIRLNSNRIKILNTILEMEHTTSALELIRKLPDIDKTTIYRTLDIFEKKGLLLKDLDREGISQYCINVDHNYQHLHFYCKICHKTLCKDVDNFPQFNIVDESVDSIEIKITGVCKNCLKIGRS